MHNYTGLTVLVTGSASGIGLEIAKEFAQSGALVTLADRDADGGARALAIVKELGSDQANFIQADLLNEEDLVNLYKIVGKTVQANGKLLDIVVNNAGIDGELGNLENQSTENIDRVLTVNVRGTMLSMREAIRIMKPQGKGIVINLASIASDFRVLRSILLQNTPF